MTTLDVEFQSAERRGELITAFGDLGADGCAKGLTRAFDMFVSDPAAHGAKLVLKIPGADDYFGALVCLSQNCARFEKEGIPVEIDDSRTSAQAEVKFRFGQDVRSILIIQAPPIAPSCSD